MAGFTKKQLETILKDTQEHLAETKRLGPGYYRIRERYDYAVEADERYIEKLRKQIAEYDQSALNENQQIVLEWLKWSVKEQGNSPMDAVYLLVLGESLVSVSLAYIALTPDQQTQVLAVFSKEVAE
ncbi:MULTISPECIES: hypothetical protein [Enterococcus]|uniref:hypothetical protein n=1 Tax=Enterococcus TaxID=1350 RepID=UPI000EE41FD7|nr:MULTISPECIES: hypothetical protein [Enterococcus]HCM85561.1 hypothetical protein [Enterococcus sp.]